MDVREATELGDVAAPLGLLIGVIVGSSVAFVGTGGAGVDPSLLERERPRSSVRI